MKFGSLGDDGNVFMFEVGSGGDDAGTVDPDRSRPKDLTMEGDIE